jgi:hypothetical protein
VTGHRYFKEGRSLAFRVKHWKRSETKLDREDEHNTILRNVPDYFPVDKAEHPRILDLQHDICYYVKSSYLRNPKILVVIFVSIKLFITNVASSTGSDNFMDLSYHLANWIIYLLTTIALANIGHPIVY